MVAVCTSLVVVAAELNHNCMLYKSLLSCRDPGRDVAAGSCQRAGQEQCSMAPVPAQTLLLITPQLSATLKMCNGHCVRHSA